MKEVCTLIEKFVYQFGHYVDGRTAYTYKQQKNKMIMTYSNENKA